MGVLEISGLVFIYMLIGYTLGKITYNEYKKDIDTEDLGISDGLKRLLLFPASYHDWDNRSNGVIGPFSAVATLKEKSYKISMFLWPLKLIPTAVGIAEVVFYLVCNVYEGIAFIPGFIESKAKFLKRAKMKLLSSPVDLSFQINEMEIFLENLDKTKKSLYNTKELISKRMRQLAKNLEDWKTSSSPEESGYAADIINGLTREIAANRYEFEKLEKKINVLTQKESELKGCVKTLVRCQKTIELKANIISASACGLIKEDGVASLAGASISSANSLMVECKDLLSEAF